MELNEAKELAISALVLALAFSIALLGGAAGITSLSLFVVAISIVTVSTGFLLHELGHRFVARRFGSYAEYRMWPHGLLLALMFSLFGFVFAAPGAVMIHARADLWGSVNTTRRREGLISISGPAINVALALLFTAIGGIFPVYSMIAGYGAAINIWLALFNMIPFPPLDGSKVFSWDKRAWLAAAALIIVLWRIL